MSKCTLTLPGRLGSGFDEHYDGFLGHLAPDQEQALSSLMSIWPVLELLPKTNISFEYGTSISNILPLSIWLCHGSPQLSSQ